MSQFNIYVGCTIVALSVDSHNGSQCSETGSDRKNFVLLLVSFIWENIAPITKMVLLFLSIFA